MMMAVMMMEMKRLIMMRIDFTTFMVVMICMLVMTIITMMMMIPLN